MLEFAADWASLCWTRRCLANIGLCRNCSAHMPCMSSSFRLNKVVNFYPVYSPTDSTWSNKRRCLTFSIFENIFIFYRFGPCCRRHHSRKSRRWSILLAARPQSWTCWTRWRLWRRRSKSGMSTEKKHNFVNLFTDVLAGKYFLLTEGHSSFPVGWG